METLEIPVANPRVLEKKNAIQLFRASGDAEDPESGYPCEVVHTPGENGETDSAILVIKNVPEAEQDAVRKTVTKNLGVQN